MAMQAGGEEDGGVSVMRVAMGLKSLKRQDILLMASRLGSMGGWDCF
jgi:hypothetical protein